MTRRILALVVGAFALLGATMPMDSQLVMQRYELELSDLKPPKAMIFQYAVSQAGTTTIEQRHQIYRTGLKVRDETIAVDGKRLAHKIVKIEERPDRYFIGRIAPRSSTYTLLFLKPVRDGRHLDYEFETSPLVSASSGFTVTRVVIDGLTFLPKTIDFHTASANATGTGEITYGKQGGHWVPLAATVDAVVGQKKARERIEWSDYRFPKSLPAATFNTPKPLPAQTLPPIE